MDVAKKLALAITVIWSISAFSTPDYGQRQAAALTMNPIRGGVYWIDGSASVNTTVITGKDGVIVIDAMTPVASAKEVLAQIAEVAKSPVTTVILTDSDADHAYGLAAFPPGLTVIAQENAKKELEATAGSRNAAPVLPTRAVKKKESLTVDGIRLVLLHFASAHTGGDLMVYLPDQKIVITGDVISTTCCDGHRSEQALTMIKPTKSGSNEGGSAEGWVETVRGLLALNADTYVPGHGPLQTKADLHKRLELVQERRDQIRKLVAEGKSLDQVKQALGENGPQPGYNLDQFPPFTTSVYNELTKKP